MALVVYDHGYRINTPLESIFPPKGVTPLEQIKHLPRTADAEDAFEKLLPEGARPNAGNTAGQPRSNATQAYQSTASSVSDRRRLAVSHIMSSPVHSVSADTMVSVAWERMTELQIRHLVVTSDDGRPLGLLSEKDLFRLEQQKGIRVSEVYSRQLIAASPDTLVRQVANSFIENSINSMPVVDDTDKVIGIVCRTDLLRLLVSGPNLERWA